MALALAGSAEPVVCAPGSAELFAFIGAGRRVQLLAYESDTSIDDHDI